jgi:hypothetical protein
VLSKLQSRANRKALLGDEDRIARVKEQLAALKAQAAEAMRVYEKEHMWLPGKGPALQSLWAPYEDGYPYWKFLTSIFVKLVYVLVVTYASSSANTDAGITGCVATMVVMLALSVFLGPFENKSEDRLDITTRLANCGKYQ